MQRSQRVRGATVAASLMNIRAVVDQQLYHRNTASLRRDMQGGIPWFGPWEVGIRAMLQEPANADGGVGPAEDVAQWRNAAWNSVDVSPEAVQQLKGRQIARARGDVHGHTVGRICP